MRSRLARNFATIDDLGEIGVLDSELFDPNTLVLPLIDPTNIDGILVTDGMRVLFTNLSDAAKNNRRHRATVGGGVISWTPVDNNELGEDQKVLVDQGVASQNNFVQIQGGVWKTANEGLNPAAGEANTASNIGGQAEVFKAKVAADLQMRTIKQGAGINVTQNANDIEIASTVVSGEVNTNTNSGAGGGGIFDLVKAKVGVNTAIRRIKQGANITITQDTNELVIAAAALGGSGFTKVTNSAQLTGTFEGDVLIAGGSVMQTDIVIKGNLFLENNISGNGLQKITVYGSVFNATTGSKFISMDGAVSGQKGGDIEIYGNCHNVSLQCQGAASAGLGSGIAGAGGNIKIIGNYHYDPVSVLGQLRVDGGLTGDVNVNGANAGSIYIGGDALLSGLSAFGASQNFTGVIGVNFAGNGGEIEVLGNCILKGAIDYYGGTSGNGTSGGNGGNFTVGGNLICESTLNTQGGNNLTTGAGVVAGNAGTLTVHGDCHFKQSATYAYRFNGGVMNSTTALGNAGQGGTLTVEGNLFAEGDIYMLGGSAHNTGINGVGGRIRVTGYTNCLGLITISGGTTPFSPSTATAATWGSGSYFLGGCNVEKLEAEDSDGAASVVTAIFQIAGSCVFGNCRFQNRVGSQLRSVSGMTTSFMAGSYSPKTTLHYFNGGATGAFTGLTMIAYAPNGSWRKINNDGIL